MGLGINFHKSKFMGINVVSNFLEVAAFYLSFKLEESSFTFLGIPIGINPRKESSCTSLIIKMINPLAIWKNLFHNLGGRITLLKSILTSLNIFTLSFYNIPDKVVKEVTKIQSNFLWVGVGYKRKIHWVRWSIVTLPYIKGDLSIKDIVDFNLALLNKWRWKIVQGYKSLWSDVLKARYGDLSMHIFYGGDASKYSSSSFWWRDVLKVGNTSFLYKDPIVSNCRFSIENGFNTPV